MSASPPGILGKLRLDIVGHEDIMSNLGSIGLPTHPSTFASRICASVTQIPFVTGLTTRFTSNH